MLRLLFILSILLPCTLQGDDLYTVRFDDRLQAVEVEACFDGPAPGQLYRNDQAARFTDWIRSDRQKIGRWSYGSRLKLPDYPKTHASSGGWTLKKRRPEKITAWRCAWKTALLPIAVSGSGVMMNTDPYGLKWYSLTACQFPHHGKSRKTPGKFRAVIRFSVRTQHPHPGPAGSPSGVFPSNEYRSPELNSGWLQLAGWKHNNARCSASG